MKRTPTLSLLGIGLLILAAACSNETTDESPSSTSSELTIVRPVPPIVIRRVEPAVPVAADQSFVASTTFATGMVMADGWTTATPRLLADVNGDRKQDVVGFGFDGFWFAKSSGASGTPAYVLAEFGSNQGWSTAKHVRLLGDIDGDGKDDIVGFGDAGVYTSLSNGNGYGAARLVIGDLGYNQGWRVAQHPRLLADVNGDGKKDIVAFGNDGVYIALATGGGSFEYPRYVMADFGVNQSWDATKHIRMLGDINGDGKEDIVGFGDAGVTVAYSNGSSFNGPSFVLPAFGYVAGSWRGAAYPRMLADINHDGKKDIVGFGDAGVYTALSSGMGFGAATLTITDFGVDQGWSSTKHARYATDINGDGYADIVGFGDEGIHRALGGPSGFGSPLAVLRELGVANVYYEANRPRLLGDMDGDGLVDAVGFGSAAIQVAKSSTAPWPGAPNTPGTPELSNKTTSSIKVSFADNSTNERVFWLWYGKTNETKTKTKIAISANITTRTVDELDDDTRYCFQVQAESVYGLSALSSNVCGNTAPATGGGGGGGGGGSTLVCGTTLFCPVGRHPDYYIASASCPGNGTIPNATSCAVNLSTYHACGHPNCASGYHPVSFDYDPHCASLGPNGNIDHNATTCQQDATRFTTCGNCPSGYTTVSSTPGVQACDFYASSICAH